MRRVPAAFTGVRARLHSAVIGASQAYDTVEASHAHDGALVGLDAARDAVHGAHSDKRARVGGLVAHSSDDLAQVLRSTHSACLAAIIGAWVALDRAPVKAFPGRAKRAHTHA